MCGPKSSNVFDTIAIRSVSTSIDGVLCRPQPMESNRMKPKMTEPIVGLTLIPSANRGRVESEKLALSSAEEPSRANS